ncbi:MAG: LapA family protein [Bacillota bacterium]|uniref:DUF1049 domain-containing protein n=1 Tax=Virgibacillus salarius TaxID=447199 RepID=A0A941DYN9_9BACI|nr:MULTISPECIES: lipopolysaccharide assembly protein LapA domain-containing protein [Bacillaceae]NAZ10229.1 DUF1049 domain-containing protein [Agaribacter marinus]MBR7797519.1 DUF1049 domain-containing protein [Virgibacillus salarius]MCC2250276.1 lipopolysaccharide assembly protein LapA domain-containing protein [Virgibacillus sp. AGTR]MDY7044641.1 lipopolysaccharide assembly protein LapA domain-containing protein [Virgibacillus sp. M23]QRZ17534.1 DUF1049 domain-containing protein [Virgibacill
MKGQTYVIFAILFTIIVAVFAVTNVESVEVNYLFWTGESPLILIILFSVLMGVIITAAAGTLKIFRLQREMKQIKAKNKELVNKLEDAGVSTNIDSKAMQSSGEQEDSKG